MGFRGGVDAIGKWVFIGDREGARTLRLSKVGRFVRASERLLDPGRQGCPGPRPRILR